MGYSKYKYRYMYMYSVGIELIELVTLDSGQLTRVLVRIPPSKSHAWVASFEQEIDQMHTYIDTDNGGKAHTKPRLNQKQSYYPYPLQSQPSPSWQQQAQLREQHVQQSPISFLECLSSPLRLLLHSYLPSLHSHALLLRLLRRHRHQDEDV